MTYYALLSAFDIFPTLWRVIGPINIYDSLEAADHHSGFGAGKYLVEVECDGLKQWHMGNNIATKARVIKILHYG